MWKPVDAVLMDNASQAFDAALQILKC